MKNRARKLMMAGAAAALLAGCDALDVKYEPATLEEAVKQQVPSATLRYRVPAPNIPVVRGNTGIVRDGNLFLVAVGPNLKQVLADYGRDVEYGIRLIKKPKTHIVLETVFVGDERVDLFEGIDKLRFQVPTFAKQQEIAVDNFPAVPAASAQPGRAELNDMVVAKRPVPEELAAAVQEIVPGGRSDRPRYFLEAEGASYVVVNPDPMTLLLLDFLAAEGKEFDGGVRIETRFAPSVTRGTGVLGAVAIRWIRLNGSMYYKSDWSPKAAKVVATVS